MEACTDLRCWHPLQDPGHAACVLEEVAAAQREGIDLMPAGPRPDSLGDTARGAAGSAAGLVVREGQQQQADAMAAEDAAWRIGASPGLRGNPLFEQAHSCADEEQPGMGQACVCVCMCWGGSVHLDTYVAMSVWMCEFCS